MMRTPLLYTVITKAIRILGRPERPSLVQKLNELSRKAAGKAGK